MPKDYKHITRDLSASISKLRKEIPDVMQGFSALAQAATKDAALDKKTKEMIAMALGVAAHCDGCIGFHSQSCGCSNTLKSYDLRGADSSGL